MLPERLKALKTEALHALTDLHDGAALTAWENAYLGRKSELNMLLKRIQELPIEERKVAGLLGNTIKRELAAELQAVREKVASMTQDAESRQFDVTLPGTMVALGHRHPISVLIERIEDIFTGLGFESVTGPEVDSAWFNFDALNFPPDHPARDMQDAFWIDGTFGRSRFLPRTHTSSVQVRYMETHTPPFRIIIPGRIFRREATDASHEHTFHQFECLMVGDDVSVAHFKYIAEHFFSAFFEKSVTLRLRPSFFPFTEPSFEFDLSCLLCSGNGCPVCQGTGWLEIGGAGMVHQNVFVAAGYPQQRYQGFAWGFGLTRLAMLKYKIGDIRLLMSGDLRFIRQFS